MLTASKRYDYTGPNHKTATLNAISKTNSNYNTYQGIVEDAIPPLEDWGSGGFSAALGRVAADERVVCRQACQAGKFTLIQKFKAIPRFRLNLYPACQLMNKLEGRGLSSPSIRPRKKHSIISAPHLIRRPSAPHRDLPQCRQSSVFGRLIGDDSRRKSLHSEAWPRPYPGLIQIRHHRRSHHSRWAPE